MGFIYSFVALDEAHLQRRRQLLDLYASVAQFSALIPLLAIYVSNFLPFPSEKFFRSLPGRRAKERQSPRKSRFKPPVASSWAVKWRRLSWYLDDDIFDGRDGWGTKREGLVAGVWTLWLLVLVFACTGNDYLHLTKRFGIVAASQLPLHYLLAAKSWSAIQYLTRMSHEELNPYHRLLGRIIIALFSAHATLYANFYIQSNLLHRFGSQTVILGLTAISIFILLGTSSLAKLREYSYLLFFTLHVTLSILILPILWFHVSHLRIYILESALIYALLIAQRNISQTSTLATLATLSLIPSTPTSHPLLSISFPVPLAKLRSYKPGQHIYLSLPPTSLTKPWEKLRLNPFTIASSSTSTIASTSTISTTASPKPPTPNANPPTLTLLIRPLRSSTARLASLAHTSQAQPVPLLIEGPYGSATYFPDLASPTFSRVLLVAGGVGATFALPVYRDLRKRGGRGVGMVWAVRRREEAGGLVEEGEGVQVFVTGREEGGGLGDGEGEEGGIELEERVGLLSGTQEEVIEADSVEMERAQTIDFQKGRPDLCTIVDEVFKGGEEGRIAVLVCGPVGMGRSLRKEVGRWVEQGREVFWHKEEFGW